MEDNGLYYPPQLLALIVSRIPNDLMKVFTQIWNSKSTNESGSSESGITWTSLVKEIGDRSIVEKALLIFEINGFVYSESSALDRRQKKYLPHSVLGRQLAKYLREQQN
ncbi:hypothetical protein ACE41H_15440 [Paenibacillus enshidis]|uniref:Uncharacterized protein n=1 Tax=Paenibacillus enshidis TaxID=1458439 RepID=A0ABV5AVB9_9BACL